MALNLGGVVLGVAIVTGWHFSALPDGRIASLSSLEVKAFGWPVPQAPGAQGALPTGDQILSKYEEALGGTAALAKVMTRTVKTRRIVDIGTPSDHYLLRYSKRGNYSIMYHSALDGTFLNYTNGCDGKGGWQSGGGGEAGGRAGRGGDGAEPQEGAVRDLPTTTGGICEEEMAFYGYFVLDRARARSHYQSLAVKGIHKIIPVDAGSFGILAGGRGPELALTGARDAYLVLGVPARKPDPFVWMYFDTQTGVLLRRAEAGTGATPVPPGDNPRTTDFIQYRAVGNGTRASFQFVTVAGANRVRGIHMSIVDNDPVDDKVFIKPKNALRFDKGL
jgi:hypothetical protein